MGGKPRAFKHQLGPDRIRAIAGVLADACADFDADGFRVDAVRGLSAMELKARVGHVIACLHASLPQPFPRAVAALSAAFELDGAARAGDDRVLRGFAAWPLIDYVGAHGRGHRDLALEALRRFTDRFSAEFAIRPFLAADPDATLAVVRTWTGDDSEHVRRLASEGTRPLLPWGQRLQSFRRDPAPVLDILEALKSDPSEYVRRSVANNLNDIAKDHPDVVVGVCRRWLDGADRDRRRLVRHALRGLVKKGHPGALEVLGFGAGAEVEVANLRVAPREAAEGESVAIEFDVRSTAAGEQNLVIDYAVHFVKANGSRSPKVFKLKTLTLGAGATATVRKTHSLARVTTRVHYPGTHVIEVLINGAAAGRARFELSV